MVSCAEWSSANSWPKPYSRSWWMTTRSLLRMIAQQTVWLITSRSIEPTWSKRVPSLLSSLGYSFSMVYKHCHEWGGSPRAPSINLSVKQLIHFGTKSVFARLRTVSVSELSMRNALSWECQPLDCSLSILPTLQSLKPTSSKCDGFSTCGTARHC